MQETSPQVPDALLELWQNLPLPLADLPAHESVILTPPQRSYKTIMWLEKAFWWLPTAAACGFVVYLATGKPMPLAWYIPLVAGLALLLLLPLLWLASKAFANKGFAIRERDLLVKKGWLFEKLHLMPYSRVQHCVVKTGPLERWKGLATLVVHSAGSQNSDLTISGLSKEEALSLKDFVSQRSGLLAPDIAAEYPEPVATTHPENDGISNT